MIHMRSIKARACRERACWVRLLAAVLVLGCAGPFASRRSGPGPHFVVAPGVRAAWTAATEGRDADAVSGFRAHLVGDPGDVFALFGDASLAFERGDVARAAASYVSLIERAAAGSREVP